MARLALRRLALTLVTALGVVVLVFLLLHLIPGDPTDVLLGERASSADRAALSQALGLDRPLWQQLASDLGGVLRGDLGRSLATGDTVGHLLRSRYPATCELAVGALVFALAISLPLGLLAAARSGSFADRLSLGLATITATLPSFALGPLLLLVFAVELPWFPVAGRTGPASLVLPSISLGFGMAGVLTRHLRSSLLEARRLDCVRAARARGASNSRLLVVHALRNAATPLVAILALQIGGLLAGAIVTETVFAWPGLGRLLVQSIGARDYPVVQGCALAIALTFVAVNLLADLAQALVDPRIRRRT